MKDPSIHSENSHFQPSKRFFGKNPGLKKAEKFWHDLCKKPIKFRDMNKFEGKEKIHHGRPEDIPQGSSSEHPFHMHDR